MNLEIGKIVYVLNDKPPKLLPGKVIEQIISRKLDGEIITHVVVFSSEKEYTLEKIQKPWFSSLQEAKDYLTAEATKLIDSVIQDGKRRAEEAFPVENSEPPEQFSIDDNENNIPVEDPTSPEITSHVLVDLGDGSKARVEIPKVLTQ